MRTLIFILFYGSFLSVTAQQVERIVFDAADTTEGYYLAIQPQSRNIKGAFVLCTSFATPESLLPETRLHNVAYANDLLVVFVSTKQKLYADTPAVTRLNKLLVHVSGTYRVPDAKFVLAGYDFAGNIALRFTELAQQYPAEFPVRPRAVMAVGSPVDLFGLWTWCARQIRKNSGSAWDARFIADLMQREHGNPASNTSIYTNLTPFYAASDSTGNEQSLRNVAVRLYYDTDLEWLLKERKSSLYDSFIPEGTELVSRLLLMGNSEAELITAKLPGRNSRGLRSTNALSIVDEVECIHWIKNKLDIFDAHTWKPPYHLDTPAGWTEERFSMPISFAPSIPFSGVEDVRFAPGWGDATNEQYWSYAFLWWIEGKHFLHTDTVQQYLKAYYEGLVGMNIKERNIPAGKIIPTRVSIRPVKTAADDAATYEGTIRMLDYMTQVPITLQVVVHVKQCAAQNRTAVITQLSPRPRTHANWKVLNRINMRFDCNR